jgi:hypothetical protein
MQGEKQQGAKACGKGHNNNYNYNIIMNNKVSDVILYDSVLISKN